MMLVFDHVCVFYGDTPVLRELSFQVRSGEQVGLIGANGAGKSTLMKAALGLLPYTGSITVDGIPVTRKTLPEVRRKLGYVLQDADNQMFMPTVLDDMVFGPMNYGLSRAAAEQRAEETLAELHMEYLRDRHNHKMSGGEKRMAAVATILAMQPQHAHPRPAAAAGDEAHRLARPRSGAGDLQPRAAACRRASGRRRRGRGDPA